MIRANQKPRRKLEGKTVLVTRPKGQSEDFRRLLTELGATVILCPTIEVGPPESWQACDNIIERLEQYDGFVFTSSNAAKYFLGRAARRANAGFGAKPLYAVGAQTAAVISSFGLAPTTPDGVLTARTLAESLSKLNHRHLLLPKGNLASDEVSKILREHGIEVDEIIVYSTVNSVKENALEVETALRNGKIDLLTFFSPSSFDGLIEVIPSGLLSGTTIAAIGPTTATAIRNAGLDVRIMAASPSSKEMVDAIISYYDRNRG